MENKQLQIFELEGSLYERGKQLGKRYQKEMEKACEQMQKMMQNKEIRDIFDVVKEKVIKKFPDYMDEVYGRADGAKVDRDLYFLFLCHDIYEEKESCTDIIVKSSPTRFIGGHNEDGTYHLDNVGLVKYQTDYGYLCDYFTVEGLTGCTFAWNSFGLIFTSNMTYVKNKNRYGIPTWFILRSLVDCKTVKQVLQTIDVNDAASGYNINIIDSKTGYGVSIEWRLNQLSCIDINTKFAHSNHYTSDIALPISKNGSNSKFRLKKSYEFFKEHEYNRVNIELEDILKILQYRGDTQRSSIFRFHPPIITAATFLYDTQANLYTIYSYLDQMIYTFTPDMHELLNNQKEEQNEKTTNA